jgi:hypothetical protein
MRARDGLRGAAPLRRSDAPIRNAADTIKRRLMMLTIARSGSSLVMMAFGLVLTAMPAAAQQPDEARLDSLSERVSAVESEVSEARSGVRSLEDEVRELREDYEALNYAPEGLLLFFIGVFCALWAQNTGRSAWGWFFLGLFFHGITLLFLLAKNVDDRRSGPRSAAAQAPPVPEGG